MKRERATKRYSSDLSEQEWQIIQPLLPPAANGRGRKRQVNERKILNRHLHNRNVLW